MAIEETDAFRGETGDELKQRRRAQKEKDLPSNVHVTVAGLLNIGLQTALLQMRKIVKEPGEKWKTKKTGDEFERKEK